MRVPWNRIAFAAAHVVSDPRAKIDPWLATAVDWDSTLAYRRYLWQQGFGVAEAMDTAQRGMGLGWDAAHELIRRSAAEALYSILPSRTRPGVVVPTSTPAHAMCR